MNYEIIEALGQIAREKSVDRQLLIETLEAGLLSAARKKFGLGSMVGVKFDDQKGVIEMWLTKKVVDRVEDPSLEMTLQRARDIDPTAAVGAEVLIPLDIAEFGRNAIQAAKQVLVQRVREAEREMVYDEYVDKVGSLVRGVVQQVDRGSVIVKINLTEAVIPARELINRDRFRQRDHVRAYVLAVDKLSKGPQVILSRTHPNFLVKLFEAEVPEIAEGIVEIKSVAREAGHRSKIAVYSRDDRIDAVGACVGIKGSRVQSIVRELGGERIDIVPWSSDPVLFVSRALNPARVIQAALDDEEHKISVTVADDQLSLAIGKGGQNARLAAKLTGWNIDLVSQSEVEARRQERERGDVPVEELEGITPKLAQKLISSGIETAGEVRKAGLEGLQAVEGVGEKTAEKILATAEAALVQRAAEVAEAAGEIEEIEAVEVAEEVVAAGVAEEAETAGEAAGTAEALVDAETGEIETAGSADDAESAGEPGAGLTAGIAESAPEEEGSDSSGEAAAPKGALASQSMDPGLEAEKSGEMMESFETKPEGEERLRRRHDDDDGGELWNDIDRNEEDGEDYDDDDDDDDDGYLDDDDDDDVDLDDDDLEVEDDDD